MSERQDEFQAVRDLFPQPEPPRPEVVAAVRAGLLESEPGRPRPRSRSPRSHHPRIRLRVALPATAATAVVAAAAVAIAISVQAPGAAGPAGASTRHPATVSLYHLPPDSVVARPGTTAAARRILLTAARTVVGPPSQVPPAGSRYYEDSVVVGNFIAVGPARDRYLILEKVADQSWTALRARRSPSFARALSVQAASRRDAAAWRRDGSPTSWSTTQDLSVADPQGYANGSDSDIVAGRSPLKLSLEMVSTRRRTGPLELPDFAGVGGQLFMAPPLRGLADHPARLKAALLKGAADERRDGGPGPESYLFQTVPLILALPISRALRSALYRLLASLPGVQSLGRVTDAVGKPGVAVALTGHYRHCGGSSLLAKNGGVTTGPTISSCTVQQRLVINPRTGMPLAQELRYVKLPGGRHWTAPDGLFSFQLFRTARWTSASPPAPAS